MSPFFLTPLGSGSKMAPGWVFPRYSPGWRAASETPRSGSVGGIPNLPVGADELGVLGGMEAPGLGGFGEL